MSKNEHCMTPLVGATAGPNLTPPAGASKSEEKTWLLRFGWPRWWGQINKGGGFFLDPASGVMVIEGVNVWHQQWGHTEIKGMDFWPHQRGQMQSKRVRGVKSGLAANLAASLEATWLEIFWVDGRSLDVHGLRPLTLAHYNLLSFDHIDIFFTPFTLARCFFVGFCPF